MVVGTVMSLATGASLPVLAMYFGDMTNTFIRQTAAVRRHQLARNVAQTRDFRRARTIVDLLTNVPGCFAVGSGRRGENGVGGSWRHERDRR